MKLGEASGLSRGQIWITERYERYVMSERSLIKERDALVQIMTRPPRVRTGSFSASGTGSCGRKRQFQYLGFPQNRKDAAKTMKIFANGDYVHLRYQVAGLVSGWLKAAEVLYTHEDLKLVGTADGLTVEDDLVEFKSINSYGFSKIQSFGPDPKHVQQVNAYMFLSGAERTWLLYENKDNQETKEFRMDRNDAEIGVLIKEAEQINQATDRHELLPMLSECERGTGRFQWCEYNGVCPGAKWPTRAMSSSALM